MSKPKLKMKKPEYLAEVNYGDLNAFINKVYGFPPGTYEVVASQEWSNDSSYTAYAQAGQLPAYIQSKLDKFKASKGQDSMYMLNTLLSDCVNQGLLEPGKYLIKVSW